MGHNMINNGRDCKLINISGKLVSTHSEFENLLRETLLSKIVVKNLRKGNITSPIDSKDKIQKMPFWKVIISSYVEDIIDKEGFKGINELKNELKIFPVLKF